MNLQNEEDKSNVATEIVSMPLKSIIIYIVQVLFVACIIATFFPRLYAAASNLCFLFIISRYVINNIKSNDSSAYIIGIYMYVLIHDLNVF